MSQKAESQYISVYTTPENRAKLRAYAETNGLLHGGRPSEAQAAKVLLARALEEDAAVAAARPVIEEIKREVSIASSRAATFSAATLLYTCLSQDQAPAAALGELNADELFAVLMDMAAHDMRGNPRDISLYGATYPAVQRLLKGDAGKDALLDELESTSSVRMLYVLDEADLRTWLEGMATFRATRESARKNQSSAREEDVRCRKHYRASRSRMLAILAEMGVTTVEEVRLLSSGMVFSRAGGWHDPGPEEHVDRVCRKHCDYAGMDTRDPNWISREE